LEDNSFRILPMMHRLFIASMGAPWFESSAGFEHGDCVVFGARNIRAGNRATDSQTGCRGRLGTFFAVPWTGPSQWGDVFEQSTIPASHPTGYGQSLRRSTDRNMQPMRPSACGASRTDPRADRRPDRAGIACASAISTTSRLKSVFSAAQSRKLDRKPCAVNSPWPSAVEHGKQTHIGERTAAANAGKDQVALTDLGHLTEQPASAAEESGTR
jgi:hypothetical protein